SRSVPGLVAGGTSSASTILTIPAGTAAGSYRLIARADAGDEVTETQDANNTSSRAIQIGADLLVSLSVPATAMAGTELAVTDTTRNPGGGGAGATTTAFYLSGDTSLSADDAALGSRPVPPLGAGAASR